MNVEITEDPIGIFEIPFGTPVGRTLPNGHVFAGERDPDGNNGFEIALPETIGSWAQNSAGARSRHTMIKSDASLLQLDKVTPAGGRDVLQIEGESTIESLRGLS